MRNQLKSSIFLLMFLSVILISTEFPFAFADNPKDNLNTQLAEAENLRRNGRYKQAIDLNLFVLQQINGAQEKSLLATCYKELGILYWNIGELLTSKTNFSQALSIAKNSGISTISFFASQSLSIYSAYTEGKKYRSEGETVKAISSFLLAIETAKQISSAAHQLKCERQLSLVYFDIGKYTEYYQLNKSALELARQINNAQEMSNCLNNIGVYFLKSEDYARALNSFEEAKKIAIENGDIQGETDAINNLSVIYLELGDYDKALSCISRSLEIDEDLNDLYKLSTDCLNRGSIYRKRGLFFANRSDYQKAKSDFINALFLAEKNSDIEIQIAALNNVGSLFTDLGQFEEATLYFNRALLLCERSRDLEKKSRILNNLGIIYSKLNLHEKSNQYFRQAIVIAAQSQDIQLLWEAFFESANGYADQNKYIEALANYEKSIVLIEAIRSTISTEDLKASYLAADKRLEAYQNLISILVKLHRMSPTKGYDKEALDYLERAKARAFLDSLEVAKIDISGGINPVLSNREKFLTRNIARSYSKLLSTDQSATNKERLLGELKANEDQLESLKREIRATSSAYADLKYPKVITYDELGELRAAPDIAYFAYSLGKDSSFAFAILPQGLKVFDIPARKILQQQVTNFRKAISDRQNRDFELGRTLFKELVQPGLEPGIKKIMIIPDDILNLLPFEALLTNGKPDSWLVRDYMIGYAPSLSSLRVLQARHASGSRPRKDLLAIGNPTYGSGGEAEGKLMNAAMLYDLNSASGIDLPPLRYSAVEVENISHLFSPKKVTILQKEEASSRWLRSHPLSDYKIIHFATHSVIDDKKPARSAILLSYAPDQAGNGLFQAREIYNLKLNADLVTLSACQTGLGQFIRGEGIEGLSRAFFYAGSSSVLMSLWSVNDQATYLLMERFYRHLKSSESIMGALRNAKLEMIGSGALSHPFYWAGFVISGKADAKVFSRSSYSSIAFIVFAAVIMIAIIGISFRRRQAPMSNPDY